MPEGNAQICGYAPPPFRVIRDGQLSHFPGDNNICPQAEEKRNALKDRSDAVWEKIDHEGYGDMVSFLLAEGHAQRSGGDKKHADQFIIAIYGMVE